MKKHILIALSAIGLFTLTGCYHNDHGRHRGHDMTKHERPLPPHGDHAHKGKCEHCIKSSGHKAHCDKVCHKKHGKNEQCKKEHCAKNHCKKGHCDKYNKDCHKKKGHYEGKHKKDCHKKKGHYEGKRRHRHDNHYHDGQGSTNYNHGAKAYKGYCPPGENARGRC